MSRGMTRSYEELNHWYVQALTPCMCFLISLWNWKTSKEGKDGKVEIWSYYTSYAFRQL